MELRDETKETMNLQLYLLLHLRLTYPMIKGKELRKIMRKEKEKKSSVRMRAECRKTE